MLVVGDDHPWAGRTRVDAKEFADTDWVLREPGSGTRSAFEAALERLDGAKALRIVMELPSNEAVRAAAEAGAGATVISASVAAPSLEAGLVYQVPFDLPDRAFEVVRHRERQHSRAAEALLDIIRQGSGRLALAAAG